MTSTLLAVALYEAVVMDPEEQSKAYVEAEENGGKTRCPRLGPSEPRGDRRMIEELATTKRLLVASDSRRHARGDRRRP